MPYDVECRDCGAHAWVNDIVDLLSHYTNKAGRFVCTSCGKTDTFIYRNSDFQEGPEERGERWIKGVIQIDSGMPTYCPYVFLTANSEDGPIVGLHFHYYKDRHSLPGGRLLYGYCPGGPPVLNREHLFMILRHLVRRGMLDRGELRTLVDGLEVYRAITSATNA